MSANMNDSALIWLQQWQYSHCNGDWEHDIGIRIETLDNPGWSVSVNLEGTELEARGFDPISVERSDNDWITCRVCEQTFEGFCGPMNLIEILNTFRRWAEGAASTTAD